MSSMNSEQCFKNFPIPWHLPKKETFLSFPHCSSYRQKSAHSFAQTLRTQKLSCVNRTHLLRSSLSPGAAAGKTVNLERAFRLCTHLLRKRERNCVPHRPRDLDSDDGCWHRSVSYVSVVVSIFAFFPPRARSGTQRSLSLSVLEIECKKHQKAFPKPND